jgi:two-component sensor histidine kinase
VLMYTVPILLAGMLLGPWTQASIAAFSIVMYLSIAFGIRFGKIIITRSNETMFGNRIIITVSALLCITALIYFLINQFQKALDNSMRREKDVYDLAVKNIELVKQARNEINNRTRTEKALSNSLAEKELLLKEIHHRVKNNLNMVVALLGLQSDQTTNAETKSALSGIKSRIYAIALIHELLYRMETLPNIDFGTYINQLITHLHDIYLISGEKKIKEIISVENISLDITSAVPCGILVGEILTNAYKHAFEGRETGTITVDMRRTPEGYLLNIGDDGTGMDEKFQSEENTSLGMKLIHIIVENQLRGSIRCWNEGGLKYEIRIPLPSREKKRTPAT